MDAPSGPLARLLETWRDERAERLSRRRLDPADLAALADAGHLRAPVPAELGGDHTGPDSARALCEDLRGLARVDPSLALVSSMHPAVLSYWSTTVDPTRPRWQEQRHAVLKSAARGRRWGTVTSEPGSGGDIMRTRTRARPVAGTHPEVPGDVHLLTGDKHFASGFGACDFMMTTARVDDRDDPDVFVIDVRAELEAGTSHLRVVQEWDGAGMRATQSHAVRLEDVPAVRMAWDGPLDELLGRAAGTVATIFTAVVLGVVDEAVATAHAQLEGRAEPLRALEQVAWTRAELDHWLAVQAYRAALDRVGGGDAAAARSDGLRAKVAVAELAEACLRGLCQALGGGTFSARSPFSHWYEDVRALGFLRPPWGLAFDAIAPAPAAR